MILVNRETTELRGEFCDILAEFGIATTAVVMAIKKEKQMPDCIIKQFITDVCDCAVEAGLKGDFAEFGDALERKNEQLKAEKAEKAEDRRRNQAIDDAIDDIFAEMFRRD